MINLYKTKMLLDLGCWPFVLFFIFDFTLFLVPALKENHKVIQNINNSENNNLVQLMLSVHALKSDLSFSETIACQKQNLTT